jgi:hypothetical protein
MSISNRKPPEIVYWGTNPNAVRGAKVILSCEKPNAAVISNKKMNTCFFIVRRLLE